ncbi:hypothetical protein HK405_014052, partial [Cladochytrium tenue]
GPDFRLEASDACITALAACRLQGRGRGSGGGDSGMDVAVGDDEGSVMMLTGLRTVLRGTCGARVTALARAPGSAVREPGGERSDLIAAGDARGAVTAFDVDGRRWRTQVGGVHPAAVAWGANLWTVKHGAGIRCMQQVEV